MARTYTTASHSAILGYVPSTKLNIMNTSFSFLRELLSFEQRPSTLVAFTRPDKDDKPLLDRIDLLLMLVTKIRAHYIKFNLRFDPASRSGPSEQHFTEFMKKVRAAGSMKIGHELVRHLNSVKFLDKTNCINLLLVATCMLPDSVMLVEESEETVVPALVLKEGIAPETLTFGVLSKQLHMTACLLRQIGVLSRRII